MAWGAGLGQAWLGSSSLFLFSAFCLFGFALVYLCVRFLLTEASVNDIAVLNSMLGTLLCPCFGLFPFESEGFLSGQLLGSRGFHCGGREPLPRDTGGCHGGAWVRALSKDEGWRSR